MLLWGLKLMGKFKCGSAVDRFVIFPKFNKHLCWDRIVIVTSSLLTEFQQVLLKDWGAFLHLRIMLGMSSMRRCSEEE